MNSLDILKSQNHILQEQRINDLKQLNHVLIDVANMLTSMFQDKTIIDLANKKFDYDCSQFGIDQAEEDGTDILVAFKKYRDFFAKQKRLVQCIKPYIDIISEPEKFYKTIYDAYSAKFRELKRNFIAEQATITQHEITTNDDGKTVVISEEIIESTIAKNVQKDNNLGKVTLLKKDIDYVVVDIERVPKQFVTGKLDDVGVKDYILDYYKENFKLPYISGLQIFTDEPVNK